MGTFTRHRRLNRPLGGALVGLSALLISGAASAQTTTTTNSSYTLTGTVQSQIQGGAVYATTTARHNLPSVSGARYTTATAQVPSTRIVSGALNSAARGIRHPAFVLGVMAADYVLTPDGEVVRETIEGVWSDAQGEVFYIEDPSQIETGVQENVGSRGGILQGVQDDYASWNQPKVLWQGSDPDFASAAYCSPGHTLVLAPQFSMPAPKFASRGRDAVCYSMVEFEPSEPHTVTQEVVETQTVADALTPETLRRILTDILSKDDPDHVWHDEMPDKQSPRNKPVPQELANVANQQHTDLRNANDGDPATDPETLPDNRSAPEQIQEDLTDPTLPDLPAEPEYEVDVQYIRPEDWRDWDSGLAEDTACPASPVMDLGPFGTHELDYTPLCYISGEIRPVVIGVGYIIALLIIVRR